MKDCCSNTNNTNNESSKKTSAPHCCPSNGEPYKSVKYKTLLHHVLQPWINKIAKQKYYFCTDPDCDVVYYGEDDSVIRTDELRTNIGQKTSDENANICYCFGVTKAFAALDSSIKNFVRKQTMESNCSCEISNPSGRCCLKDFPTA